MASRAEPDYGNSQSGRSTHSPGRAAASYRRTIPLYLIGVVSKASPTINKDSGYFQSVMLPRSFIAPSLPNRIGSVLI